MVLRLGLVTVATIAAFVVLTVWNRRLERESRALRERQAMLYAAVPLLIRAATQNTEAIRLLVESTGLSRSGDAPVMRQP